LNRPILTLNIRIYSVPTISMNAAIPQSTPITINLALWATAVIIRVTVILMVLIVPSRWRRWNWNWGTIFTHFHHAVTVWSLQQPVIGLLKTYTHTHTQTMITAIKNSALSAPTLLSGY